MNEFKIENFQKNIYIDDENLLKYNNKYNKNTEELIQSFAKEVHTNTTGKAMYSLVNSYRRNGNIYLIYRLYAADGSIDIHEYQIKKDSDNTYKIEDIYIHNLGMSMSTKIQLEYLLNIPNSKLKNKAFSYYKSLKEFYKARLSGDEKEANKIINNVSPETLKRKKIVEQLQFYNSRFDEENYVNKIEKIIEKSDREFRTQLIQYKYSYENKEYKRALNCLSRLEEYTHDPFLKFEKGNVHYAMKDYVNALKNYNEIKDIYQKNELLKINMLMCLSKLNNFKKAIDICELLIDRHNMNKQEIIKNIKRVLPELGNSQEFKKWKKN